MGWLIEFVRREFKDVKTDFKYDVYKYIALGAGGAMLALIYALYQKLRHISVDWFVFAGLFVFSFLIFSLAISASRRRTRDAGELGQQLPAAPNPVKKAPPKPEKVEARALYMTGWTAGGTKNFNKLLALIDNVVGVVIRVKPMPLLMVSHVHVLLEWLRLPQFKPPSVAIITMCASRTAMNPVAG